MLEMQRVVCFEQRWAAEILGGGKKVEIRNTKRLALGLMGISVKDIPDLVFGTVEVIAAEQKSFSDILAMSDSTGVSDAEELRKYVRGDFGWVFTLDNPKFFHRAVRFYSDDQGCTGKIPAAVQDAVRGRCAMLGAVLGAADISQRIDGRKAMEKDMELNDERLLKRYGFGLKVSAKFLERLESAEPPAKRRR